MALPQKDDMHVLLPPASHFAWDFRKHDKVALRTMLLGWINEIIIWPKRSKELQKDTAQTSLPVAFT